MKKAMRSSLLPLLALFIATIGCGTNSPNLCAIQSSVAPIQLSDANGVATYGMIPANYNPGVQSPWVLYNHGSGQSGLNIPTDPHVSCLANALVQAGYVVIASDYKIDDCWGNAQCVTDMAAVQERWKGYLNLRPAPYVIAESMGGIVTWNAVAHGTLAPRAVVGIYPACSLSNMYAGGTGPFFQDIQLDYDFSSPADYLAATAGYDPMLDPVPDFTTFPILMYASYTDTSVVRSQNEDPFAARVNAAGGNAIIVPTKGNHGDASNFNPKAVVAFFDRQ